MTFEKHEVRIREERTLEASKKKLMGANGKLGIIMRNLGQPIFEEFRSYDLLDDAWDDPEYNGDLRGTTPDEILREIPVVDYEGLDQHSDESGAWNQPEVSSEGDLEIIGWQFDGLSRGINLQIRYDEWEKKLTANFKGILVYHEEQGELMAYVPHEVWESKVDWLYALASKKHEARRLKRKEDKKAKAEQLKNSWWGKMRDRWGL